VSIGRALSGDHTSEHRVSPRHPTGVTIVAILGVIWGIMLVIIGALIVAFLGFAGMYFGVFVAIFGASFSTLYVSLGVL